MAAEALTACSPNTLGCDYILTPGIGVLPPDHLDQVLVPPAKPRRATPQQLIDYKEARHAHSSTRICVEHGNAHLKIARNLNRGRPEEKTQQFMHPGRLQKRGRKLTFRQRNP